MGKIRAFVIVGVLLLSGVVMVWNTPKVSSNTEIDPGRLELVFDHTYMIDEQVWYKGQYEWLFYHLGEGDGIDDDMTTGDSCRLRIEIMNIGMDTMGDFYLNITNYDQLVFDFEDTDFFEPGCQTSSGPFTLMPFMTMNFDFWFDILAVDLPLGTSSYTEFTATFDYIEDPGGYNMNRMGNFDGWIYLSSVFDDPYDEPDRALEGVWDDNEDIEFEAGDEFEDSEVWIDNYGEVDLEDLVCTLTEPGNGVTLSYGINTASLPYPIGPGMSEQLLFRTDVAPHTPPGTYPGLATMEYTREDSGLRVTESDLGADWLVDFNFADQDPVVAYQQYSEYQLRRTNSLALQNGTWDLQFIDMVVQNNGNCPLYNFAFFIDDNEWDMAIYDPMFYWVENNISYYDVLSPTYSILDVGESMTLQMRVTADFMLPLGYFEEHFIYYDGNYYDDGSTGNPSGFPEANGGDAIPSNDLDDLAIYLTIEMKDMNAGPTEVNLDEGWNLVSLPLFPGDVSIPNALADIDGKWDYIMAYDAADPDPWKTNLTYRPDSLNDLDALNAKRGFWIRMTEPGHSISFGPQPPSTSMQLYAGWNLVGYPTLDDTTNVATALWGTQADCVMVFDPEQPYNLVEVGGDYMMRPGEGYWVHVPSDTLWTVDW